MKDSKDLQILWREFIDAFREGLGLYFSPFIGFWQALGKLRIPSMVHGIFKPSDRHAAHH
jgi:hypothetical protein